MVEPIFDYQFRLILIGDSTVGKSSLLKYFTDGRFAEVIWWFFQNELEFKTETMRHGELWFFTNEKDESNMISKALIERKKSKVSNHVLLNSEMNICLHKIEQTMQISICHSNEYWNSLQTDGFSTRCFICICKSWLQSYADDDDLLENINLIGEKKDWIGS